MNLQEAVAADRREDVQVAVDGYERALASGDRSLRVLVNLALLYWQTTDPGLAAKKTLSPELMATAGRRIPELLAEAQERFPNSTEPRFWQKYIAWADLGERFSLDECEELLRADPSTLTPVMHIFALTRGAEREADARELLRQCREDGTTGARYVASVIEGVLKRAGL
jgi:hypothetical protein